MSNGSSFGFNSALQNNDPQMWFADSGRDFPVTDYGIPGDRGAQVTPNQVFARI
jgi:hypothetical protein